MLMNGQVSFDKLRIKEAEEMLPIAIGMAAEEKVENGEKNNKPKKLC
jgi:bifunctional DNase/RNase